MEGIAVTTVGTLCKGNADANIDDVQVLMLALLGFMLEKNTSVLHSKDNLHFATNFLRCIICLCIFWYLNFFMTHSQSRAQALEGNVESSMSRLSLNVYWRCNNKGFCCNDPKGCIIMGENTWSIICLTLRFRNLELRKKTIIHIFSSLFNTLKEIAYLFQRKKI